MKINQYVEFYFEKYVVSGTIVSLDNGITLKTNDGIAVIKNTDAVLFYKIKQVQQTNQTNQVVIKEAPQIPSNGEPILNKLIDGKYNIIDKIEKHKDTGKERYGIPGFFKEQTIKHDSNKKV